MRVKVTDCDTGEIMSMSDSFADLFGDDDEGMAYARKEIAKDGFAYVGGGAAPLYRIESVD